MSLPTSPETFEFFARYVLAGFIVFIVRNAYIVGERPKLAEITFDILLFSLVNQLLWLPLAALGDAVSAALLAGSTAPEAFTGLAWREGAVFYAEVLLLPTLIGIVTGRGLREGWALGLFRALTLPIVDPIPRAYDHVFSRQETCFVILTFRDGSRIYGYYGPDSRAGRDPGRSEIFLERLYSLDANRDWIPSTPPRSALVSLEGVRMIEFLPQPRT